ncbi:O-antigen ligase family protein [Gaetbulibacter saemankumensis]|uniref:O-antigen ligase family protein n=1 Tax=Gaetbulibacter saemankumensis TaxID=311208 RepID=UPI001FE08438|nr:O-antigen ligase family protein [Gaetbulibacter saemankumensis]
MIKDRYIRNILLHVLIGMLIYFNESLAKLYFFSIIIYFFFKILRAPNQDKTLEILKACTYVLGAEVLLRMTKGSLLYEGSKYLVILFAIMGLFHKGFKLKATSYVLYLLLLIPGIYVSMYLLDVSYNIRKAVAFNLSGPVCLGISALFCMGITVSKKQLEAIINYGIYPLISTVIYIVFYTPDISEVVSTTGSNFAASGGYGPNQVATVLGLGAFFATVKFFNYSKISTLRYVNLALILLFSFRAMTTFSRGGVLTAIIMILCFVFFEYKSMNKRTRSQMFISLFLFLSVIAATWVYSSIQTSGLIEKRYANQNAMGEEKADITTGRVYIFMKEVEEFLESPFLGVGVGRVKDLRFQETGIHAASHNEMSRILAEHGLLGIMAFTILLLVPLFFRLGDKSNTLFFSFYFFWFLTINHSAMRIAAPAFIYGLCLLNIRYEKTPVYRKSIES